jgi:hypothetical protein
MDFPDFGNDDVQVENNVYENLDDGNIESMPWNNPVENTQHLSGLGQDPFSAYQVDEEEENRQRQRKAEEEERRTKLMAKMNDEVKGKQETKDKARDHLDQWKE